MTENTTPVRRLDGLHIFLIVLLTVTVTAIGTYFLIAVYLFPPSFKPVSLSAREEIALQTKLERLNITGWSSRTDTVRPGVPLKPEPYLEDEASRTIRFSEREINALLAKNTDLADKVAIDLSGDMVSARILIPVDETFPVLGGKTLRVHAGVTFRYEEHRPLVMLRGVSLMGVPLPNAWLGYKKNIDLVREFGGSPGFWKALEDGIQDVRISEGLLTVTLKE